MSIASYDLGHDLEEVSQMAQALDRYVRQDQLYYNLGVEQPTMTLGGFLLRLHRLHFFQECLSAQQIVSLHHIDATHKQVQNDWAYHYRRKLASELQSRLEAIQYYLRECAENDLTCADNYRPEAQRRTIMQEILSVIKHLNPRDMPALMAQIDALDDRLRARLTATEFLWDAELRPAYPASEFWWLYAQPQPDPA